MEPRELKIWLGLLGAFALCAVGVVAFVLVQQSEIAAVEEIAVSVDAQEEIQHEALVVGDKPLTSDDTTIRRTDDWKAVLTSCQWAL